MLAKFLDGSFLLDLELLAQQLLHRVPRLLLHPHLGGQGEVGDVGEVREVGEVEEVREVRGGGGESQWIRWDGRVAFINPCQLGIDLRPQILAVIT